MKTLAKTSPMISIKQSIGTFQYQKKRAQHSQLHIVIAPSLKKNPLTTSCTVCPTSRKKTTIPALIPIQIFSSHFTKATTRIISTKTLGNVLRTHWPSVHFTKATPNSMQLWPTPNGEVSLDKPLPTTRVSLATEERNTQRRTFHGSVHTVMS